MNSSMMSVVPKPHEARLAGRHTAMLADILGRDESLFRADIEAHRSSLSNIIRGTRLLVIGGSGSIGQAFVRAVLPFEPAALHVVDPNENSLVELVRSIRCGPTKAPDEFVTYSIPVESRECEMLVQSQPAYDYILNFAALKHVRAERDPLTLMRLLRVNVLANSLLLAAARDRAPRRIFAVSSDKAVNPASAMGASKALMERLLISATNATSFSSTRFANVAFSDGSLLEGFLHRFAKRQPLAAPSDIRRYFISPDEAGEMCLAACFLAHDREIFVPRLDPARNMKTLSEVAERVCRVMGYEPLPCGSEEEAITLAQSLTGSERAWPCFFASSRTSGEKPFEEFWSDQETIDERRFAQITVVTRPLQTEEGRLRECLRRLEALYLSGRWTREDLLQTIRLGVPEFAHVDRVENLDQKM